MSSARVISTRERPARRRRCAQGQIVKMPQVSLALGNGVASGLVDLVMCSAGCMASTRSRCRRGTESISSCRPSRRTVPTPSIRQPDRPLMARLFDGARRR
jgi:hypothetical protein